MRRALWQITLLAQQRLGVGVQTGQAVIFTFIRRHLTRSSWSESTFTWTSALPVVGLRSLFYKWNEDPDRIRWQFERSGCCLVFSTILVQPHPRLYCNAIDHSFSQSQGPCHLIPTADGIFLLFVCVCPIFRGGPPGGCPLIVSSLKGPTGTLWLYMHSDSCVPTHTHTHTTVYVSLVLRLTNGILAAVSK